MAFGELLALYGARLAEAVHALEAFLRSGEAHRLRLASELLASAGRETYAALAEHRHAILAAMSLEAAARLEERAAEIERRGLREDDLEYVADVCELLKRISGSISSGEYEKSYREMISRRRGA
jgi:hypothetical protein